MGLRKLSLDLVLVGAGVGVHVGLELLLDSFSLIPLSSDVWDLEKPE